MSARQTSKLGRQGNAGGIGHGRRGLSPAQQQKLKAVPAHLHRMYRKAVTGRHRSAAIRFHCLECCGRVGSETRKCTAVDCILYAYRLGGYPGHDEPRRIGPPDPSQAGRQPVEPATGEGGAVPLRPSRRSAVLGPKGRPEPDQQDDEDVAEVDGEDGDVPREGDG
jgi:hypothetical protein